MTWTQFARGLAVWALGLASWAHAHAQPGFFETADMPAAEPVSLRVVASKPEVRPGDQLAIAVVFDLAPGWHLHTNAPKPTPGMIRERFEPTPTVVAVDGVKGVRVGPVQWPEVHEVPVDLVGSGRPEPYGVFEGRAAIYVPLMVEDAPPDVVELTLRLEWQACDDRSCMIPEDRVEVVRLPLAGGAASDGPFTPAEPEAFAEFDIGVFGRAAEFGTAIAQAKETGAEFNVFGWAFTVDTRGVVGLAALLGLAAVGGLALNLTPCVLPVIPIKIMGLSQAAANPARCLLLGVVMSVGVVAFWLGIGAAITFVSGFQAVSTLFQQPWFSIVVAAVIAIMAVGMLGVFTTGLPQWVYRINPRHDSLHGSFLFGVMTAVLSTPCTAPFMGSAAVWATQQKSAVTLATFAAIGVGMALPYLFLSAKPGWVNKVPRTGPASELVKQVMGLLMLAVAVFFAGTGLDPLIREPIDPPLRAHWWGVAGLVAVAAGWLIYRTFRITRRPARRASVVVAALAVAAAAGTFAAEQNDRGPVAWEAWTPERFEAAMGTGKVVVIDFTAEWCLNCKALEAAVLHRDDVASVLNGDDVIAMKVDITGGYPAGVKFMQQDLRWANVPLLAVFGPEISEPLKYDSYTPATVLGAIKEAGGKAGTAPGPRPDGN